MPYLSRCNLILGCRRMMIEYLVRVSRWVLDTLLVTCRAAVEGWRFEQ